jgi:hypothetical protein
MLIARDNLTSYTRTQYDTAATNAQQGLIEYAQELQEDDLHTRMPDIMKKSRWNRQFKSYNKTQKRLMTEAEAAERDVNQREQAIAREARVQGSNAYLVQGFEPIPSTSTEVERVPDTPPRRAFVAATPFLFATPPQTAFVAATPIMFSQIRTATPFQRVPAAATLIRSSQAQADTEEREEERTEEIQKAAEAAEVEEAEEAEEAFMLPPSTAPAALSRAGRKRAPTLKALEAEKASKRGTRHGRVGRGRGRGSSGGTQGQRQ